MGYLQQSKFEGATAAQRIRGLMSASGVSPSIPASLRTLGTGVPPGPVVVGACKLSLEYLQQALLAWLGYSGPVISPVIMGRSTFP